MKRLNLLTLISFLLLCSISTFAQRDNTKISNGDAVFANGIVFYDFVQVIDTTQPDKVLKDQFQLIFSANLSKFESYNFVHSDSAYRTELKRQLGLQADPSNINIDMSKFPTRGSTDCFYTLLKNSPTVLEVKSFVGRNYFIEDKSNPIKWDIEDSTRVIGGYTCQKATGKSHGRNYIAWFTTDLPYSFGPRKLNGLPGLILEAHDDAYRIIYTFNHIILQPAAATIALPNNGIYATSKEFTQMRNAFYSSPNAMNQLNASELDITDPNAKHISITKGWGGDATYSLPHNYPIELPNN